MNDLYVGYASQAPNFATIQEAVDYVPQDSGTQTVIHIAPGTYRERLEIRKPFITFLGEKAENTILVFGHYALEPHEDGRNYGTFRSYSVLIDTHDFTARNITFQNDAGYGYQVGQAVALYAEGDKLAFYDCRLLASQDTLFTGPLPAKEAKPGGFVGPKEFAPRINGRQYYKNCYIRGDVDYVFGCATAYFEECEFFSQLRPDCNHPWDGHDQDKTPIHGYVTAASTPEDQTYGYVINRCKFTSDCPPATVYLGRPWREFGHTVLLNCELGSHIRPEGWHDWNKPHASIRYAEYKSYGPGANPDARASFSRQLTDEEALKYTRANVLGDWTV